MPAKTAAGAKSGAPRAAKVQRWIDLLAALLVRHYAITFEQLARDVPAYGNSGKGDAALMRMFERDKDELRSFGVPIVTTVVEGDDGPRSAYLLSRRDFYLPYLCATAPSRAGASRPRRVDRFGYKALATLTFEPDELAVIAEAAACSRALGDPLLTAETDSAIRKLAVDLPMDASAGELTVLPPRARPDPHTFEVLSDALTRSKRVKFEYSGMASESREWREVEPYGLFFLSSHWYLAARDVSRGELRNFRLSRIADAQVNTGRPQTTDYSVPESFDLRQHAKSRQAWELGDGDALEAVVEFRNETGVAAAAERFGTPVEGEPAQRRFSVRRLDSFARWLLSFAGDAVPLEPASLVSAYAKLVDETLALYATRTGGTAPHRKAERGVVQ